MCMYYRDYEVYDMVWSLNNGNKTWKEFYHEIELNDLFSLMELNEYTITELELKIKHENDKCVHKVCNDLSFDPDKGNWKMQTVVVRIDSINDNGNLFQFETECNNKIDATRYVLTYVPKRGYEIIHISFEFLKTLVWQNNRCML